MENITGKPVDRSKWPAGPWDNEPDRVDFIHAGFSCFIKRHPDSGHWCGYVGVPSTHPFYKSDEPYSLDLNCHGGITYGDICNPESGICHIPEKGMPEDVYWLGFDAHHSGDLAPMDSVWRRIAGLPENSFYSTLAPRDSYKTAEYMIDECKQLAEELERIKS